MKACRDQSGVARIFTRSAAAAKLPPNSTRPFSIRLSEVERQQLEREAGPQPLGTYVRARLLDSATRRRASSASSADSAALGQILGRLGRLNLASSLSDLASAARVGAIAITPELEREVQTVSRDVREMRDLLMRALGFKPEARA